MKYITLILVVLLAFAACKPALQAHSVSAADKTEDTVAQPFVEKTDATTAFKALALKKAALSYQVTYHLTSLVNELTIQSEMTQYFKKTKSRIDTGVKTRVYMDGKTFSMCTNQGTWYCSSSKQQSLEYGNAPKGIELYADRYHMESLPPRSIAGTTASCFRIVEENTTEYCFSPEGVPLYLKSASNTDRFEYSGEMVAQSYNLSVPDSAFDLPAEPQAY